MDKPAPRTEAAIAWEMFHESIRRLDAICKRDNCTLKLTVPMLGAVKKKKKPIEVIESHSSGEPKP